MVFKLLLLQIGPETVSSLVTVHWSLVTFLLSKVHI